MENKTTPPDTTGTDAPFRSPGHLPELNIKPRIRTINLDGDKWVIVDELPGVYCEGTQYYDLKNIGFINMTGLASLIALMKSLLVNGVKVQFVNVSEQIRSKIRLLGLDRILSCN